MAGRPRASLGGLTRRTRKSQARTLRSHATPAEERFWSIVRSGRINGLRFRRQHQIGTWIVDFYCHELRLIVELAGSVHGEPAVKAKDQRRQKDLESMGFKMLELINEVVLNSPQEAEALLRAQIASLIPAPAAPPPTGEGGAHRHGASRDDGRVGVWK